MYDTDKPLLVGLFMILSLLAGTVFIGVSKSDTEFMHERYGLQRIEVDGTSVLAEIADTSAARADGLGGRERIPTNQGMLFVFEEDGVYPIWMKGMLFPLDVYWVDSEGVIVDAWFNAQPESYPAIFSPRHEARYVLEVTAGFSEVFNIEVGDVVTGLPR